MLESLPNLRNKLRLLNSRKGDDLPAEAVAGYLLEGKSGPPGLVSDEEAGLTCTLSSYWPEALEEEP